jgi:hypothetical protein
VKIQPNIYRATKFGWTAVFLTLVLSTHSFAQTPPKSNCLSCEPSAVKLTGTLVRKTFPGPPNYASVQHGDKLEIYWLLNLAKPICVDEDTAEPGLNPAHKGIRTMQLVIPAEFYKKYKSLVGHEVVVTGTLFGEHTAHHKTPVLVMVNSLAIVDHSLR